MQNDTSSEDTEVSSKGKETEFETKISTDSSKRFDYLLQQTEIFSHFISTTGSGPKSPLKVKSGRPKKSEVPVDAAE